MGISTVRGSEFQAQARKQVEAMGAKLLDDEVIAVGKTQEGQFLVRTAASETAGDYLVLAAGKAAQRLAKSLGVSVDGGRVAVDTSTAPTSTEFMSRGEPPAHSAAK
jgi:thioredoxin reductase